MSRISPHYKGKYVKFSTPYAIHSDTAIRRAPPQLMVFPSPRVDILLLDNEVYVMHTTVLTTTYSIKQRRKPAGKAASIRRTEGVSMIISSSAPLSRTRLRRDANADILCIQKMDLSLFRIIGNNLHRYHVGDTSFHTIVIFKHGNILTFSCTPKRKKYFAFG